MNNPSPHVSLYNSDTNQGAEDDSDVDSMDIDAPALKVKIWNLAWRIRLTKMQKTRPETRSL